MLAYAHTRERTERIDTVNTSPRPITGQIRQRINRSVHDMAQVHETRLRALWLAKVQAARNAGASFAELNALIDALEAQK